MLRIPRDLSLADSVPAVRQALAIDRAGLIAVRRAFGPNDRLAREFELAIRTANRFLESAQADLQQTMSPLRTSVPGARRIVAATRELAGAVCARAGH